jgi:3-hydroxyisobutyrate dehydrogenase
MLGLGNMGSARASNLLVAGYRVTVFNRTPEESRPLKEKDARVAATPAAADGAEIITSMVTGDKASREIWLGPHRVLTANPPAGRLAIECSTVSRQWTWDLVKAARSKGLRFLDCPIAGRPDVTAAGMLVVFAGCEADDLDDARPALAAIGKSVCSEMKMNSTLTGSGRK